LFLRLNSSIQRKTEAKEEKKDLGLLHV
jgi:hypothetical protein